MLAGIGCPHWGVMRGLGNDCGLSFGKLVMGLGVSLNGSQASIAGPLCRFERLYQRGANQPSTKGGHDPLPDLLDFLSGNRRLIRQRLTF